METNMKRKETKRNETKRNETKRNETKRNETKRNETKRNEGMCSHGCRNSYEKHAKTSELFGVNNHSDVVYYPLSHLLRCLFRNELH